MIRRTAPVAALLCCLAAAAAAQVDFAWEAGDRGALTGMSEVATIYTDVINTGAAAETFVVTYTPAMPDSWFSSLCEGALCYAPWPIVTQFTFDLAPGDTNVIGVNMTPVTNPGAGTALVTVTAQSDPSVTATLDFTFVSDGVDVLIVDGDTGGDPAPALDDALAGTGLVRAVWRPDAMGTLAADDLAAFPHVLWAEGGDPAPLDDADRAALSAYAQGGGLLYLSGRDVARALAVPPSLPRIAWLQNTLGVQYVTDDAGTTAVAGVTGDALGDGLAFDLAVGGAPDVVAAADGAAVWTVYAGGQGAGTRRAVGDGRTVFSGFAFEDVAGAQARQDLLAAVMGWLVDGGVSAAGPVPAAPLAGLRAAPNPFNPRTRILFTLGGARAVPVRVDIHDLRGRRLRRLDAGTLSPGPQRLAWDGRDDAGRGLPSGLYLARVHAGASSATVKLTLAR